MSNAKENEVKNYLGKVWADNVKNNLGYPIIVSIFICLAQIWFYPQWSRRFVPAHVMMYDCFLLFVGVLLFLTVYTPEYDHTALNEVRFPKYKMIPIYLVRFLEAYCVHIIIWILYMGAFVGVERAFSKNLDLLVNSIQRGFFLGSLGMLSYTLFHQIIIGYMVPFAYYLLSVAVEEEWIVRIPIFTLLHYEGPDTTIPLTIFGFLFIAISMLIEIITNSNKKVRQKPSAKELS